MEPIVGISREPGSAPASARLRSTKSGAVWALGDSLADATSPRDDPGPGELWRVRPGGPARTLAMISSGVGAPVSVSAVLQLQLASGPSPPPEASPSWAGRGGSQGKRRAESSRCAGCAAPAADGTIVPRSLVASTEPAPDALQGALAPFATKRGRTATCGWQPGQLTWQSTSVLSSSAPEQGPGRHLGRPISLRGQTTSAAEQGK
mmetsp:Transcript_52098/g.153709  ORF Transcript_52098/g.153709 Transcript_52098/m.153709 type:complete len:206 (+) Transcript_52098:557-1174(+)